MRRTEPHSDAVTACALAAARSLIAYLKSTADAADTLPIYFPDRMLDGSGGWFTVVRQTVQVRDRALGVPPTDRDRRRGSEEQDGGRAIREAAQDPEWGGETSNAWPRIVVFGEPGAGKSRLLRFDEWRLGLQWKQIDERSIALDSIVLPLGVALADVATAAAVPSTEPLDDGARAERVAALLVNTVRDRAQTMLRGSPRTSAAPRDAPSKGTRSVSRGSKRHPSHLRGWYGRHQVARLWFRALRRRSERYRVRGDRMRRLIGYRLPPAAVTRIPTQRFGVMT